MEDNGFKLKYLPQHPILGQVTGNAIICRREFLEKNRSAVIGVLKTWAKSTVFMLENPKATAEIYAEMFPGSLPKGKTREQALKSYERIIRVRSPITKVDTAKGEKWGQFDKDNLALYIKEYLRIDPKAVDFSKYYTNELVDAVNDFDEDAVRNQARNYK